MSCHDQVSDPDPSHPVSALGCHACHLGNPYSGDKKRAHFTMVRNPGDLRVADRTCGRKGCHGDIVPRVKNSIMATNKGILKTLQDHWPKPTLPPLPQSIKSGSLRNIAEVRELFTTNRPDTLALDYYGKMCGGCHLWKERGDRPGEKGRRGGGCSDCHVLDKEQKKQIGEGAFDHPTLTTRIPSDNCVKCHNRSARIGLSYFGKLESAGYGTPYEGSHLSSRQLSGNRFFLRLEADVHFSKVQLDCIDCHTSVGLMGDGTSYSRMKDQVDMTCQACHSPRLSKAGGPESLAHRLVALNRQVPEIQSARIAFTQKGTPIYNLRKQGNKVVFFRKRDGHPIELNMTFEKGPVHKLNGHDRLSCQACHSTWMPQCYGCHLTHRKSEDQRDWITGNETRGRWKETRSYLRFLRPTLGIRDDTDIFPVSSCQAFVSVFDEQGLYQSDLSFQVFTMTAFDPHTTARRSRPCMDCHGDPKTLGLGQGILRYLDGRWVFRPTYDSESSGLGISFPLDGFVGIEGTVFQGLSWKGTRPFNKNEMAQILSVNMCLGCHDGYGDKIYRDFQASKKRFDADPQLPCRK